MLDPMLRRTAAETEGVELLLGHTVEQLCRTDGRVDGVVARIRSGERRELRAPLVVGADGRASPSWPSCPRACGRTAASTFFAHYRDLDLSTGNMSQMWMREPDAVYAFPTTTA